METRSLEELQNSLDRKRMELAYVTEFKSYLNVNKINQAIKNRELFKNSINPELRLTTEDYLKLMGKLFDDKGQLVEPVPDGWLVDVNRANAEVLGEKFLNNEKFNDAERFIIESIDSSVVNTLMEADKDKNYLQGSIDDTVEDGRMKQERTKSIIANARKSLSLNLVNKSFFINGELGFSRNDRVRNATTMVFSLTRAESTYNREVNKLESELNQALGKMRVELIENVNELYKNMDASKKLTKELFEEMEGIEQDSSGIDKVEEMKAVMIKYYVLASQEKAEIPLFKPINLSGELKKFMSKNLNMTEEDIAQRKKQDASQGMALSHRS